MNQDPVLQQLTDCVRAAFATTLDAEVRVAPATLSGPVWVMRVMLPGQRQLILAFERTATGDLVRILSGQEDPSDDVVRHWLGEICSQIGAAATAGSSIEPGKATCEIDGPVPDEWTPASTGAAIAISSATLPASLVMAISANAGAAERAAPAAAEAPSGHAAPADRLDVLLDIDLPLQVRFGCTQLPLKTLSRLGPGSLIDLSRAPDDPVELLVGDRIVARGEVVVVSGSYGIRVLEVVSRRESSRATGLR